MHNWVFIRCLPVQRRLPWEAHDLGPNSRGRAWRHSQVKAAGEKILWRTGPLYTHHRDGFVPVFFICKMGIIMVNMWWWWWFSRQVVPDPATPWTVHGILWARILEWVAISCSRDLSNWGIEPRSPALQADSLLTELWGKSKYLVA